MKAAMSDTATAPAKSWMDLANPTRFIAIADKVVPWLAALAIATLAVGLWLAFSAPEDYQQGITVRIMYIHVPFAWLAMMCYSIMSISALGTLVCIALIAVRVSTGDWRAPALAGAMLVGIVGLHMLMRRPILPVTD
jgi:ABC-type transport system involved in cytochrome c biogenesis permease subunit